MLVSFLEDLTQIIFNDSLKQSQQQDSKVDKLPKLYTTRFHVQERPIQFFQILAFGK